MKFLNSPVWAVLAAVFLVVSLVGWESRSQPVRATQPFEIACWSWKSTLPQPGTVEAAQKTIGMNHLLVRMGRFEVTNEGWTRKQKPGGQIPKEVPVTLVYNASPEFLEKFESFHLSPLARTIFQVYEQDQKAATENGASIWGIQLDFDIPTRLLPRYRNLMTELGGFLGKADLSITGLPTWLDSPDLEPLLEVVSYWVPQCYGREIPRRLEKRIPISSPDYVQKVTRRLARLKKPFLVGLATYGYAIHYNSKGNLVQVIGDFDPSRLLETDRFHLMEGAPFSSNQTSDHREKPGIASHWRYVYQADSPIYLGAATVKAGEFLVLDVPTVGALEASVKAVYANGGNHCRGICLFRLPEENDQSCLTLPEIQAGLGRGNIEFKVKAHVEGQPEIAYSLGNAGTLRAVLEPDSVVFDLYIPAGSIQKYSFQGFSKVEPMFLVGKEETNSRPVRTTLPRANLLRCSGAGFDPFHPFQITVYPHDSESFAASGTITVKCDDGVTRRQPVSLPTN